MVAAEDPASPQVNEYFLAAARGAGQLALVMAVNPQRHRAAAWAGCLAGAGPGQDMNRPARYLDIIDGKSGQMRDQGGEDFKFARRA